MNKVEKAILKTLSFFAIFSRPLTLEEIWHFLYKIEASKLQVLLGLKNLQKKEIIFEKNLYFSLATSKNIFKIFEANKMIRRANWRKVQWVIKILRHAPFVKNISVINSLSFLASNKESDIDILIITKKNRLWTARAFVVLLLEIIGQNKNKWHQAGKFCLGFAFDETMMDLNYLRLKKDIYFTYWLANLEPVFDRKIYENLIRENEWLYEELPNWELKEAETMLTKLSILEKMLNGHFGDKLENWLANIQIKRVWADPENLKGAKGSVIADGRMLKMHPRDRRPEYQRQWEHLTRKALSS